MELDADEARRSKPAPSEQAVRASPWEDTAATSTVGRWGSSGSFSCLVPPVSSAGARIPVQARCGANAGGNCSRGRHGSEAARREEATEQETAIAAMPTKMIVAASRRTG